MNIPDDIDKSKATIDGVPVEMIERGVRAFHNCCGPFDWRLKEALRVALEIPFDRNNAGKLIVNNEEKGNG